MESTSSAAGILFYGERNFEGCRDMMDDRDSNVMQQLQLVSPYRDISEMSNLKNGGSGEQTEISNPSSRGPGHYRFLGRSTDRRGQGRGAKSNAVNPTLSAGDRPTHCRVPSILHIRDILPIFIYQFQQFLLFLWYITTWISCTSLLTHYLD